jgi:hypothetical protein
MEHTTAGILAGLGTMLVVIAVVSGFILLTYRLSGRS